MIRSLRSKAGLILSGIGVISMLPALSSSVQASEIKMVWKASGTEHPLKTWTASEIENLKTSVTHEKDPATGRIVKGPEMSLLIDKTIANLPGDQKAQVDLIILKNHAGESIQIPRWLFIKYPVAAGVEKGTVKLVLPLSSRKKIWEEGLPLNKFQFHEVAEIEFGNYQQRYGSFYLKRRMDPLALRGEKIFIQNCTSCHASGIEKSARKLASAAHPQTKGAPELKSRELRALISYLDAFRLENPQTSGASFTGK